jgi:hypothetical protein
LEEHAGNEQSVRVSLTQLDNTAPEVMISSKLALNKDTSLDIIGF